MAHFYHTGTDVNKVGLVILSYNFQSSGLEGGNNGRMAVQQGKGAIRTGQANQSGRAAEKRLVRGDHLYMHERQD